jgi:hypothetical protein
MRGGAQIGAVEGALANQGVGRVGDLTDMDRATYARALQALQGSGELSSRMRQQHADESFARYGAEDAGSRFDYDYLRDVNARNVGRRIRSTEGQAAVTTGVADQAAARAQADAAAEEEQIMGILSLATAL